MIGTRLWTLASIILIAAIIVLGWLLGVAPRLAESDAADLERGGVETINVAQEARLVELREQNSKLDSLEADLAKLRTELPDSPALDVFTGELAEAAAAAGVTIKSVTAAEATAYGAPPADGQQVASTPTTSETPAPVDPAAPVAPAAPVVPQNVFTVGVTIQVGGPASAVVRFSDLVQGGHRLFAATQFDYAATESVGTLTGFLYVVASPAVPTPTTAP